MRHHMKMTNAANAHHCQAYDRFCRPVVQETSASGPSARSRPPATAGVRFSAYPLYSGWSSSLSSAAMRTLAMTVVPSTSRSAYSVLSLGSSRASSVVSPAGGAGYGVTSGDQPRTTASAVSSPVTSRVASSHRPLRPSWPLPSTHHWSPLNVPVTVTERSARSSWNASPGCHSSASGTAAAACRSARASSCSSV